MLDFRIHTFLCVCRHMNYTRAAAELHITQPAVSQHIRYLEREYCRQGFFRHARIFILVAQRQHVSRFIHTDIRPVEGLSPIRATFYFSYILKG